MKLIVTLKRPEVIEALQSVQPRSRGFFVEMAVSHFIRSETGRDLLEGLRVRNWRYQGQNKKKKIKDKKAESFIERLEGDLP